MSSNPLATSYSPVPQFDLAAQFAVIGDEVRDAVDGIANFVADDGELRGQIKLRNRTIRCSQWIRAHAETDPGCNRVQHRFPRGAALFFRELGADGDGIVWIDSASLFLH